MPVKAHMPSRRTIVLGICLVVLVLIALLTRSSTITYRNWLNADEGDVLAAGRRGALSLVPFNDFTSTTYGPMWPLMLGWLHRLGMPLTIPMGRVLAALIVIASCMALLHAVQRRWNLTLAVIVVMPLAIHWLTGFYHPDFLALSTEMLGLAFVVAGSVIAFPRGPVSLQRASAGAMLFGCAACSKYAFAVVVAAALVALAGKLWVSAHGLWRTLGVSVLAPAAPGVLLCLWALVCGVPLWKIIESPRITFDYYTGGGIFQTSPTFSQRIDSVRDAVGNFGLVIPLVVLLVVTLAAIIAHHRREIPSHVVIMWVVAACAATSSIVSLMVFVPVVPHYLNVFLAGVILTTCVVASTESHPIESRPALRRSLVAALAVITVVAVPPVIHNVRTPVVNTADISPSRTSWSKVLSTSGGLLDRTDPTNTFNLSRACPRASKVLVWGWAPELYSQYDWVPATRYVITNTAMSAPSIISNPALYRPRLLADFLAERPTCVLDAATMATFIGWGPELGIDTQWPRFSRILSRTYTRHTVVISPSIPISVWVRNN